MLNSARIKIAVALVVLSSAFSVAAQGTAFTYQGRLTVSGAPANGFYDLQFTIYDADTNGNPIGGPLTNAPTTVSNGLFTVSLDFGSNIFNGDSRWLQIGARTNGSVNPYTLLAPLQPVTAAPYAMFAPNAGAAQTAATAGSVAAANISGTVSLAQLPSGLVTNGASGVAFNGTFVGDGTGLTNLNANQITSGTIPDSTLSTNVLKMNGFQTQTIVWSNAGVYSFTVPAGVTGLIAKLWGAGGAGTPAGGGGKGGGGAFVQKSLSVVAGQTYQIVVGQGGFIPSGGGGVGNGITQGGTGSSSGGQGGQASSFFYATPTNYLMLAVAGAGGGSGYGNNNGGAGGNPGESSGGSTGGYNGIGGVSRPDGAPGSPGDNYATNAATLGISSLSAADGNGGNSGPVSTGGGGGGFGGGGGGGYANLGNDGGAGGGSYGDIIIGGSGPLPGNTVDSNYVALSGNGGINAVGHDGLAVIVMQLPSVTLTGVVTASRFTGDGQTLTNLNVTNLTGVLAFSQLPPNLVTNTQVGVTLTGAFAGNGSGLTNVPGAEPWQTVTGASQAATANYSYLVTNSAPTTVTLPTSANIGDVITVSGGPSSGGWTLTPPLGESVVNGNSAIPIGVTWTHRYGVYNGIAIASSSDGTRLIESRNYFAPLYLSTDSGASWAPIGANRYWYAVATSADGSRLFASETGNGSGGPLYVSYDSGATWTSHGTVQYYYNSIACSTNGTKVAATVSGGLIYTSADSGTNWIARAAARNWNSIASSADGTKLVATVSGGQIYTSTDSGTNWTARASNLAWRGVASSADGTKLVATVAGGAIYGSTDSGVTWTALNSGNRLWSSISSSADGTKLIACIQGGAGGQIYTSTDSGVTWTGQNGAPSSTQWTSVACSANGQLMAATCNYDANSGGDVYTSAPVPTFSGGAGATATLQYVGNGQWESISSATIRGDGSGLTNLNASQLTTGTIPAARLPANITATSITASSVTATTVAATNISASTMTASTVSAPTVTATSVTVTNLSITGTLTVSNINSTGPILGINTNVPVYGGWFISTGPSAEFNFYDRGGVDTYGQWSYYAYQGKAYFWLSGSGNRMSIDTTGNVRAIGTFYSSATPDIAETIPAADNVEAGDIVCADPERSESVIRCDRNSHGVLGVISDGTSGFIINANGKSVDAPLTGKPLVLAGRVPVKASLENGPIKIGDYLTASSTPGVAMRADGIGTVIGIALSPFDEDHQEVWGQAGKVLCFIKLGDASSDSKMKQLEQQNNALADRLQRLEKMLQEHDMP